MTRDRLRFDITSSTPPPSKTEASAVPPSPRRRTRVIVKVRNGGYVPPGFEVRSRIDDFLFTALALRDAIERAATDPKVVSIAPARVLRSG